MKGLKFVSLAMASLMAISLVGCGQVEDPKVRFIRECKQSLSADECQQLAYNKSQEEQARIMKNAAYNAQVPQTATAAYAAPQYQQPSQPVYVQPANSIADTATGAVVGLAAGAAIGHAIGSSNNRNVAVNNQRQIDIERANKERVYQQQVRDANQYRAEPVKPFVDPNKTTRFAAPTQQPAPAPKVAASPFAKPAPQPIQQPAATQRAASPFAKPAAAPPATKPAPQPKTTSYTPRPSVFAKP